MLQAKLTRHLVTSLILAMMLTILGFQPRVRAAEFGTGVYLLGYQSSLAGCQPAPGFYLRNDFYVYQGNAAILPFSRRIQLNLRGRVIADLVTATYVTHLKILRAHYGVGIIWSAVANNFLKGGLEVNTRFPRFNQVLSRSREGGYTGVGDLIITPINLGWNLGQFHVMAFGNLYAPVGAYNPNRRLNIGLNRWALEPNLAVTWLQPTYGQEISFSLGYTVNFENPATQYRTGNEFHLEYFLGQHLPKGFALGLAGYIYEQVTGDTGAGASLGAFHGETIALGPCLTFNGQIAGHAIGLNARYYNEVKVTNRLDGQSFFLTLTLGI
jgi:hypothetical protein